MTRVSVRIKLNPAGVAQLLTDPGVAADIERRTRAVAAAAGPGMEASMGGRKRARGSVITATGTARRAEASDRALTRALDAGRR